MPNSDQFDDDKRESIVRMGEDGALRALALEFMAQTGRYNYTYWFNWLGLPFIQFPQDMVALQEIIWSTRPDLIVETGVARGGGVIFYASMLQLLGGAGKVIGIEIALRESNRAAILAHPLSHRVRLIDGSSTDPEVVRRVRAAAEGCRVVLVVLDSNHTHEHVLKELELYSPLVRRDGYVVVMDTTIEDQPGGYFQGRPWNKTDNPKTAVRSFLQRNHRFVVDRELENKLLLTVAREGWLRCVKD
jgi:cephalosporin hydroxylase